MKAKLKQQGRALATRGHAAVSSLNRSARSSRRNIGIAAHIDAGKTTLTERILLHGGCIHRAGDVHDGNTLTDFHTQERLKGITIQAASVSCPWTHSRTGDVAEMNIIDTPGHVDFTAEVERSLRVLDGMVAVFCGVAGVQPQSETVWRQADRYGVPRVVFINKMDRTGADFEQARRSIERELGACTLPVRIPLGAEDQLEGWIDVLREKAILQSGETGEILTEEPIPGTWLEATAAARALILDRVGDRDDAVADYLLRDADVPLDILQAAIRRLTLAGEVIPVVGGSAYKFRGVQGLLDAVLEYLPEPDAEHEAPFSGLAYKVCRDPQKGKVIFVRVYTGRMEKGMSFLNPRTGKTERIGRLLQVQANNWQDIAACEAGDIVGIAGLKSVKTGDTLCDPKSTARLEPPVFPEPVLSMAIEPASRSDQDKLSRALHELADEDPTFQVGTDAETGQTLISGMGELHLEVLCARCFDDFKVEVRTGKPKIAYRETIQGTAMAEFKLDKQTGGPGQYAVVKLEVRPNPKGSGNSITNLVTGGRIPKEFISSCEKGIESGLCNGVLDDDPVVDVHVDLVDGAFHSEDSNDQAFQRAAKQALQDALRKASPVCLEPVMKVDVQAPESAQGALISDLNRRRARIERLETEGMQCSIRAKVPLAELFGYADAIRSLSKGKASFSMEPDAYEPAPRKT